MNDNMKTLLQSLSGSESAMGRLAHAILNPRVQESVSAVESDALKQVYNLGLISEEEVNASPVEALAQLVLQQYALIHSLSTADEVSFDSEEAEDVRYRELDRLNGEVDHVWKLENRYSSPASFDRSREENYGLAQALIQLYEDNGRKPLALWSKIIMNMGNANAQ